MTEQQYFSIIYGEGSDAVDIGRMFDGITNINRGVGNQWNNVLSDGYGRYGSSWVQGSLGSKKISFDFVTHSITPRSMFELRKELARVLDAPNGPKKLFFNDQPNTYYWAVPDGQVTFTEDIRTTTVKGTVTFLVPDGLLHSTFEKVLKNGSDNTIGSIKQNQETGETEIIVKNDGSVDAYPKIKIKNNSTNGYIGIAHAKGVMEIGYKGATTEGATTQRGIMESEKVFHITPGDNTIGSGWGQFVNASGLIDESPMDSTVGIFEGKMIFATNYGNQNGSKLGGYKSTGLMYNNSGVEHPEKKWNSAASVFNIPADDSGAFNTKNFRADFNIKYWQSAMGQTGRFGVAMVDNQGKLIAGWDILKDDLKGDDTYTRFYTAKNQYKDQIKHGANNNEQGQRLPNLAYNSKSGQCSIIKEGPALTFVYNGQNHTYRNPAIEFKEVAKIYIIGGRRVQRNKEPAGIVGKMIIESFSFVKNYANRVDKVPNRYLDGSIVEIDTYNGLITKRNNDTEEEGKSIQEDLVHGSEFFNLPPGEQKIVIRVSDFSTMPDVTVSWKESWL